MEQLKFKDLVKLFDDIKKRYSIDEILEMPIYLGDGTPMYNKATEVEVIDKKIFLC